MWVFVFNSLQKKKKKKSYQLAPVPFLSMQSWFPRLWLQVQTPLLCSVAPPRPWASDCTLLLPLGDGEAPWGQGTAELFAGPGALPQHSHPLQGHQQGQGCARLLGAAVPALQSKIQHQPTGAPLSSSELQQPREHCLCSYCV